MTSENYRSFTEVAGIPVLFAWRSLPPGSNHVSDAAQFVFRAADELVRSLEAAVSSIAAATPGALGKLESISSTGALKPVSGHHANGLAFDLVDITWENTIWHSYEFSSDPFLYLAVEAHFRTHFGTVRVPNRPLSSAHFHLDLGTPIKFSLLSESRVAFVQACLHYVYGELVEIDGGYGPQTQSALRRIIRTLGLKSLEHRGDWLSFLETTAKLAFDKSVGKRVRP